MIAIALYLKSDPSADEQRELAMKSHIKTFFPPIMCFLAMSGHPLAHADKTLTIVSPATPEGKVITLDNDPSVTISYTPAGMKLEFDNLAITVICIEDPSNQGLCRLQAYDGEIVSDGNGSSLPGAPPSAPSASAGDASVSLAWQPPQSTGGSPIIGYEVRLGAGSADPVTVAIANTGSSATTATISGLTNGTSYRFRVAAITAAGRGGLSATSSAVTPSSGSTGGGDTSGYSSACGNLGIDVQCEFAFSGDLDTNSLEYVNVGNGKVLTIPFRIPDEAQSGAIQYFSFTRQSGYTARTWFSYSPNGTPISGDRCVLEGSYFESTIYWRTASSSDRCVIDPSKNLVFLNMRYQDGSGDITAISNMSIEIQ